MKTNLTKIAVLLAFAAATPVAMSEPEAKEKKVTKTETTTTTTKTEEGKPEAGTIARFLEDSVTFSILNKAVKAAGLEEALAAKGPNTLFAPTDEAFEKLPKGTLEKLMLPENKEKLRNLLSYHLVPGEFLSASLKDGDLKTLSGDKVEIDVKSKITEVNGAKIVNPDQVATNGIIHVVDTVLVPKTLDGFAKLDN